MYFFSSRRIFPSRAASSLKIKLNRYHHFSAKDKSPSGLGVAKIHRARFFTENESILSRFCYLEQPCFRRVAPRREDILWKKKKRRKERTKKKEKEDEKRENIFPLSATRHVLPFPLPRLYFQEVSLEK